MQPLNKIFSQQKHGKNKPDKLAVPDFNDSFKVLLAS